MLYFNRALRRWVDDAEVPPPPPRPVWAIPRAEFLGAEGPRTDLWIPHDNRLDLDPARIDPASLRPLPGHPRVKAASLLRSPGNVVLLLNGRPIGQYEGDTLVVLPRHRGKGLGRDLALVAAEARGGIACASGDYTRDGWRAHVAAHRTAVQRALAAGHDVPATVLADYPGLTPDAGPRLG